MLHQFVVKNYALIDELSIEWNQGFTAITGETGAGKSILLGALGLIVGNRADTSSAKNSDEKVIVEASFHATSPSFQRFFEQHDLDAEALSLVRREITPSGKSRAFINDTPVKLPVLKALGELLVDIHGQHQTLLVQDQEFQLDVLDHFAGTISERKLYHIDFKAYKALQKELQTLQEEESRQRREQDYIQFQFDELQEARLHDVNLEASEQELEVLSHAEEIKQELHAVQYGLSEGEQNVMNMLREAMQRIQRLSGYNDTLQEIATRLQSSVIELEDIDQELARFGDSVQVNNERQELLNERIDELHKLLTKHQCNTIEELTQVKTDFEEQLNSFGSLNDRIELVESQLNELLANLQKQAKALHTSRIAQVAALSKEVETLLKELGLEKASFDVAVTPATELKATGKDNVSFLFSANPGRVPEALHKVASGGEMSRCMLALKYILSKTTALPCIIFDEIDTGVSGKVASQLAGVLQQMGQHMQVICITHLPQVAGKAADQLKVIKQVVNGDTTSELIRLSYQERVDELAAMLSGEEKTQAALANAKELLQQSPVDQAI